ncbi:cytochrome P450 [Chroococcidiopsis sp. CCALA 051]|uniref:cytochrome P450 n=1 Tax=Chroococcidiopsis sp. CCALA 051 TaxID=869949 RepID=UPI000D0D566A|nr:cytochrome P450 [Chroococcidiopsis sp. CCALA 051]MBE9015048.1 cytochrome P450 [Chroococcidiopsidales cyanobacterium LEGE 13417]PSM48226.1 cytochrome P450 [Chroococcidiopsis sp. CCALA 051]
MFLPQGPKTPPLVQLLQWIANPFALMESCAQRYGDWFTLKVGLNYRPLVYVSSPQLLQEILTNDHYKQFDAPGEINGIFAPLLGDFGVIMQSGDRHRRQRQLMVPPFHGDRMKAYGEIITEIAKQVTSQWNPNQPFSVRDSMQAISFNVILQAVFGLREGERYRQIEKLLYNMLELTNSPLKASLLFFPFLQRDLGAWSPWGNFLRQKQQLDRLLHAEIEARRANPDPGRTDILSLLMAARDEAGEPMKDEELRDELMTLLVAGHETTATALTWALYWIHKLPEVRQKLLAELDILGDTPDQNAIVRLPYLNAICSETLRIYPVGMLTFPRVVRSPVTLLGQQLEPGTVLVGSIYLAHQRQDLYPEPKQFKPERFLERQFSPYEYLPFGGGVRRCIGAAFALFEMKLVLATILSNLELSLANNRPVHPVRRGLVSAPTKVEMVMTGRRIEGDKEDKGEVASRKSQVASHN